MEARALEDKDQEEKVLRALRKALHSLSLEAIAAAYTEADGDPKATAEILSRRFPRSSSSRNVTNTASSFTHIAPPQPQHLQHPHANPSSSLEAQYDRPLLSQLKDRHFPPLSSGPCSPRRTSGSFTQLAQSSKPSSVTPFHTSIPDRRNIRCSGDSVKSYGAQNDPAIACQSLSKSKAVKGSASFGTVSTARVRRVGDTSRSDLNWPRSSCPSAGRPKYGKNSSDIFEMEEKDALQKEKVEEFLYSMLGDGFQLGIDYVRDVLGQCQGDVAKSLEILLNACKPSSTLVDMTSNASSLTSRENHAEVDSNQSHYSVDFSIDAVSDYDIDEVEIVSEPIVKRLHAAYPSMEMKTLFEVLQANDFNYSNAVQCLIQAGVSEERLSVENPSALSREVMQSLFRAQPREKSSSKNVEQRLHEKRKQQKNQFCSTYSKVATVQTDTFSIVKEIERAHGKTYGSWDDYERHRISANQHWSSMKEYFQQAAAAYQKGEYARAGILSSKAQEHRKLAEEAKERAKSRLSSMNSVEWENDAKLDLRGQHIGVVRRLLKLNLYLLNFIPCC
ncbi:hypothetical protein O6H91_06G027300 [Diphasiastrum complanatum]|uniref:Uncharacterized protein n=1 Tax=Diphasiastrum complanatum TaxID=34168 RepID=A0ACC2DBU5_DIPCM|nr:hypothetical protein O6H91_06G027300 [Diphasiastrum complanatum]